MNPRPSACEADVIPLHHEPLEFRITIIHIFTNTQNSSIPIPFKTDRTHMFLCVESQRTSLTEHMTPNAHTDQATLNMA